MTVNLSEEQKRRMHELNDLIPGSKPFTKRLKELRDHLESESFRISHDPDADPVKVAEVCNWRCSHCGALMPPKMFFKRPKGVAGLGFWIRPTEHGCEQEKAYLENHKKYLEQIERDKQRNERIWQLKIAGLVGRLEHCTFDTFEPRNDWQDASGIKRRILSYASDILNGKAIKNWLILSGPVGTGKSHLAAAVVHAVLNQGKVAYFRNWTQYLNRIQATFDGGAGETQSEIISELDKGWLVVLDDLDKRRSTEWVKGLLYTFLNNRYNKRLPTIITLNTPLGAVDPKAPGRLALHDIMGGAVLDRAIESMYDYIEFNGPSYRSKQQWGN